MGNEILTQELSGVLKKRKTENRPALMGYRQILLKYFGKNLKFL